MDTKDDSGIDSDNKSAANGPASPEHKEDDRLQTNNSVTYKTVGKTSELQRKIEKQRERNRRKDVVEDQPKKSFLLPRSRLNIPSKFASPVVNPDEQPLVSIMSDDSEEDEFAVGAPLSREAQREITQQLIKDGYNLDLEPDDEDLDLIPPRPLQERCACCPSATWIPQKCAVQ